MISMRLLWSALLASGRLLCFAMYSTGEIFAERAWRFLGPSLTLVRFVWKTERLIMYDLQLFRLAVDRIAISVIQTMVLKACLL